MTNKKRFLSLLLCCVLCLSTFSVTAFAASNDEASTTTYTLDKESTVLSDNGYTIPSNESADLLATPKAGTETWYKGSYTVGDFHMSNNNLTPVKTIGESGALNVWFTFSRDDSYSSSPIKLTFQIRNADTGYVYGTVVAKEGEDVGGGIYMNNVPAGTRIQLFFDASSISNPPGPYRKAHIVYGYSLS